jgi:hypothetical protein
MRPHALKETVARARVAEVRKMRRIYACVCVFRCIGSHGLLKETVAGARVARARVARDVLQELEYLKCHPNATPVSVRAATSVFVLLY